MAEKRIIWSSRANEELKNILVYYNQRNGNSSYSLKLLEEVDKLLNDLLENTYLGRATNDKNTRVIVMKVYLIFYEIVGDQIRILSFWDNRQNSKNRFDNTP